MMFHLYVHIKSYVDNLKGATAIEYGLIAAGISLAIAGSVVLFGGKISTLLYDDLPQMLSQL